MHMEINPIGSGAVMSQKQHTPLQGMSKQIDPTSFGEWLNRSIQTVNGMQVEADTAAQKLVTGENKDIHGTMITMQKASIALELMMEVRNKIISAYDEIRRMQF
jgi:flagellar hook-basal body complex protein FliE